MEKIALGVTPVSVSLTAVLAVILPVAAWAFPPYRSTDAETAPEGVLETRVGLFRIEREGQDDQYTSPLLRLNLGMLPIAEVVSEFEYDPEIGDLRDGAVGFKLAIPSNRLGFGIETLALLPVSSKHSGSGVESQVLATFHWADFQVHLNAGGFYDSRPSEIEHGWRASFLAEVEQGRARIGLEIFAKQVRSERTRVQMGPGIIFSAGSFDIRAALHAGLTSETSDLMMSLWISSKWKLW